MEAPTTSDIISGFISEGEYSDSGEAEYEGEYSDSEVEPLPLDIALFPRYGFRHFNGIGLYTDEESEMISNHSFLEELIIKHVVELGKRTGEIDIHAIRPNGVILNLSNGDNYLLAELGDAEPGDFLTIAQIITRYIPDEIIGGRAPIDKFDYMMIRGAYNQMLTAFNEYGHISENEIGEIMNTYVYTYRPPDYYLWKWKYDSLSDTYPAIASSIKKEFFPDGG